MTNQSAMGVLYRLGSRPIDSLKDVEKFIPIMREHLEGILSIYSLSGKISEDRLREAHFYWMQDLNRVGGREYDGDHENPDHFKHAAHLAYWLRRQKPISDLYVQETAVSLIADMSIADAYREEHDFYYNYINEYFAFDVGFNIVLFYECKKKGSTLKLLDCLIRDWDYLACVCHFLNSKNVSPHALFLIFRTLFIK